MSETSISIVIPVGPNPSHKYWLAAAIASCGSQSVLPAEVVLVDDMAGLDAHDYERLLPNDVVFRIERNKWRLGVPNSFNVGVMVAESEYSIMLGSDDYLDPACVQECEKAILAQPPEHRGRCYWYLGVHYAEPGGEDQYLPCNAALVSKSLWRRCGGFAPEGACGACDAALVSVMMVHQDAGSLVCANGQKTLYNYRRHPDTDTASRGGGWQGVILPIRHMLTRDWVAPNWGRFS